MRFCYCFTVIYCSRHVRFAEGLGAVMLYNPLFCALSCHSNNVVLSTLNVDLVYGPRSGCWPAMVDGRQSQTFPAKWIPICKKPLSIRIVSESPILKIYETAQNILPCFDEHLNASLLRHHTGIEPLHALIKCILDTFLFYSGDNKLCEFSLNRTLSEEDLPYSWPL